MCACLSSLSPCILLSLSLSLYIYIYIYNYNIYAPSQGLSTDKRINDCYPRNAKLFKRIEQIGIR